MVLRGTRASTASTREVSTPPTARRDDGHRRHRQRGGEEALLAGGAVDDGDVLVLELGKGAGEEPLGRRLDHRQPLEPLVVGDLDPLGRAGLGVGVDEDDGAPAGGGRQGGQVHRRGGLAHPTFESGHDHDHGPGPYARGARSGRAQAAGPGVRAKAVEAVAVHRDHGVGGQLGRPLCVAHGAPGVQASASSSSVRAIQ